MAGVNAVAWESKKKCRGWDGTTKWMAITLKYRRCSTGWIASPVHGPGAG